MRAVDTNVLVRLLTRDEPRQLAAAENFVSGGAWVSHVVLVETLWVLASVYSVGEDAQATAVEMLLDHRDLTVQDGDVVASAVRLFRRSAGVGFSDRLILELARKAGHLPLATFDRAVAKLDGVEQLR